MNHIFYVYAYAKETDELHKKGQRYTKHTYYAKDKAEAIAKMKERLNPKYFTFKATQGKGIDEINLVRNQERRARAKRQKAELEVTGYLQKRFKETGKMYDARDIELLADYMLDN